MLVVLANVQITHTYGSTLAFAFHAYIHSDLTKKVKNSRYVLEKVLNNFFESPIWSHWFPGEKDFERIEHQSDKNRPNKLSRQLGIQVKMGPML
jgi:hypothetical protein